MGENSNFPKSLTLGIEILELPEGLYKSQDVYKHNFSIKLPIFTYPWHKW